MGKDYDKMKNCLFYPFSIVNGTRVHRRAGHRVEREAAVRPVQPDDREPERDRTSANYHADIPCGDGGTNPAMGLMVAYNQFNWSEPPGRAGRGRPRSSSWRPTGWPTRRVTAPWAISAAAAGRKQWTGISNGWPARCNGHPDALDYALSAAHILCNDETGSKPWPSFPAYTNRAGRSPTPGPRPTGLGLYRHAGPGFSTTRSPAQIHTLAFGELFEPPPSSPLKTRALEFLRNIQIVGGHVSDRGDVDRELQDHHRDRPTQRIAKIKEALERIMQGGIQVALIE